MLLIAVPTGIIATGVVAALVVAFLRSRRYPEKNFANALINTILIPLRHFRVGPYVDGPLDLDKSLQTAMKRAKLSDYGDLNFVKFYRTVMNSENFKSQKLTNLGYISAKLELEITWIRRLKFLNYIKNYPDVLKVPVRSPVFVTGLPRTGTTLLHRLLSLDPLCRAPLLWELVNPVPITGPSATQEEKKKDLFKRADHIRKLIDKRKGLGDRALVHIHEVEYNLPEECLMAMTDEVPIHMQFLYSNYMMEKEFLEIPMFQAYRYYRKMLQLLSFQQDDVVDPKRWVLKCPMHLFYTKELAAAFPDAKLIWTHRHPISAVPSMCSLMKAMHSIYFEKEGRDDNVLGSTLKVVTANLLDRAPKDIVESKLPCYNVTYNSLVADPIGTVKAIYQEYGWEFTKEFEDRMTSYLEENKRDREKKKRNKEALHTYYPSEFGLTDEDLTQGSFAKYVEAYSLPMSRN